MLRVCSTAPIDGTARYASRCSCEFQAKVATRSPGRTPSRLSAAARRSARSATAANVVWRVRSPSSVATRLVAKTRLPCSTTEAIVSGRSCIVLCMAAPYTTGTGSRDPQDHLAEVHARRDHAVGLGGRLERQHAIDHHAELAGFERPAEAREEAAHDLGLLLDRSRAQRRADDLEAAGQHLAEIDVALGSAGEADHHQTPGDREAAQVALQV